MRASVGLVVWQELASIQECGCQPCSFPVEDNFFEAAGDLFSLEPLAGIILFTRVSLLLACSFRSTRERRLFSIDVKSIVVHIEQCRWTTTGTFVCGSCVSNEAGMVACLGPLQTWRNEQGSQKVTVVRHVSFSNLGAGQRQHHQQSAPNPNTLVS